MTWDPTIMGKSEKMRLRTRVWAQAPKPSSFAEIYITGFGGIPEPEAYQIQNEYAQRRRLRPNKFTSKSEVFSELSATKSPKLKLAF